MPVYNYKCLYCDNCDVSLAGLNDHMALCSQCGNVMVRLDNNCFWQFFDKNHFQLTQTADCPPAPTAGVHNFRKKTSIRLNPGKCRFTQLNKWTFRANNCPWRESPVPLTGSGKIFGDQKLRREEPDS